MGGGRSSALANGMEAGQQQQQQLQRCSSSAAASLESVVIVGISSFAPTSATSICTQQTPFGTLRSSQRAQLQAQGCVGAGRNNRREERPSAELLLLLDRSLASMEGKLPMHHGGSAAAAACGCLLRCCSRGSRKQTLAPSSLRSAWKLHQEAAPPSLPNWL